MSVLQSSQIRSHRWHRSVDSGSITAVSSASATVGRSLCDGFNRNMQWINGNRPGYGAGIENERSFTPNCPRTANQFRIVEGFVIIVVDNDAMQTLGRKKPAAPKRGRFRMQRTDNENYRRRRRIRPKPAMLSRERLPGSGVAAKFTSNDLPSLLTTTDCGITPL